MRKSRIPVYLLALLPTTAVCALLYVCAWHGRGNVLHVVDQQEVRPMFRRITGKELPDDIRNLHAITFGYDGIKELYLAFEVDDDAYSRTLEEFGGERIEKYEFPQEVPPPRGWDVGAFDRGYEFQKSLGTTLFQPSLLRKVESDYRRFVSTRQFPEDAIRGDFLYFSTESDKDFKDLAYYSVLAFKEQGLVYMAVGRRPKGVYPR